MQIRNVVGPLLVLIAVAALSRPAPAINVIIDYTYDTSNFFGAGNPQGTAAGFEARAALESAASFFSLILEDSFSAITVPPTFHSSSSNGVYSWEWARSFSNPATAAQMTVPHSTPGQSVPADAYIVYAGARNLSTSASGGYGGFSFTASGTGTFSSPEIDQIQSITDTFRSQVRSRDEASGFASWGGSIAFDSAPTSPWHYQHTNLPPSGSADFYTTALHEMAHALGFGISNEWLDWRNGFVFNGPTAEASYGGPVPLSGIFHWANGTTSTVYGGLASQTALMAFPLPTGTRRRLTQLDAAAMIDIGWSINPSPVPEPTSALLLLAAVLTYRLYHRASRAHQLDVCGGGKLILADRH